MEADRVRRTAARNEPIAPGLDSRKLALEPDDDRIDALVGGKQVRP